MLIQNTNLRSRYVDSHSDLLSEDSTPARKRTHLTELYKKYY